MSLDALREQLPAYAKDLSLNLSSLANETVLSDQQKWGAFVASAYAVGTPAVVRAVEAAADAAGLSADAKTAAKAAAAIMGMNNVYYRALHLIGYLKDGRSDIEAEAAAESKGLTARAISPLYHDAEPRSGLMLGFTGFPVSAMEAGAARLAAALAG